MNTSYIACEFCDESAPVSYYCETCHSIFCSDCLQTPTREEKICGKCGSNLILTDTSGVEFCQVCKTQHAAGQIIYRTLKVCPSCNSPTAVKIEQKKNTLTRDFYNIVQESRHLLTHVNEMVNRFNNCRQKLLQLRAQIPPSNHFPTLESEMLKVASLVDQIKAGIKERIQLFFDNAHRNLDFFTEARMRPQDLPLIENTLLTVRSEQNDLVRYAERCLAKVDEDLESAKARLGFVEEIIERFRPYLHLLDLKRQERPVFAMECILKNGVLEDQEVGKKTGLALLTNQKISFIYEHGIIRKKSEILFQAPISELAKAEVRGRIFKRLRLDFNNGYYKLSLGKEDRAKLLQYIDVARDFDERNKVDQEKLQELTQMRLNARDIRQLLEEQINCILHAKIVDDHAIQAEYPPENRPYVQGGFVPRAQAPPGYPSYSQEVAYDDAVYATEQDASMQYAPPAYRPARPANPRVNQAPAYIPQDPYHVYQGAPSYASRPTIPQLHPRPQVRPRPSLLSPTVHAAAPAQVHWNAGSPATDNEVFVDEKHLILNLERDSFAIRQTIEKLDQKFKNSEISQVDFLKSFRALNQELFTIQRQLSMLKEKNSDTKAPFEPETTGLI
ncbi:MAG TPA: hypothetical protein VKK79_25360 [Candidatus Lokiarchaeia archaeon]|nr:hypothetical protein [Candidatus Lokiarchaeia archaeon]